MGESQEVGGSKAAGIAAATLQGEWVEGCLSARSTSCSDSEGIVVRTLAVAAAVQAGDPRLLTLSLRTLGALQGAPRRSTMINKRKETTMKTLNYLAFASLAVLGRERMESMKLRRSLAWLILALVTGLLSLGFAGPATNLPPAQGEAALAQLKERGLYDSLQEALARARFGVYPEPQQLASWQAENPAQQIRARFTAEGVQVDAKSGDGPPRRIGMKLRSVGYGERPMGVSAAGLTTSGSRIESRRSLVGNDSAAGAITEWYVNAAAGLEQGFTLESAPGERRDGERLRVVLALEGDLRAQAVDDGQALEFKDDTGQRVLRYDHLVVRDARGRELEARMAVRREGGEGQVWLEVDDRDAVWPVTIDPTFTQQDKLLAADAASSDLFGSSVAMTGRRWWSARSRVRRGLTIKARPMSLCAAVKSGASSRNSWPRTGVNDSFGLSVALSGETVVVAAAADDGAAGSNPEARPMSLSAAVQFGGSSSNSWPRTRRQSDQFGHSVAISGETMVVGACLMVAQGA